MPLRLPQPYSEHSRVVSDRIRRPGDAQNAVTGLVRWIFGPGMARLGVEPIEDVIDVEAIRDPA